MPRPANPTQPVLTRRQFGIGATGLAGLLFGWASPAAAQTMQPVAGGALPDLTAEGLGNTAAVFIANAAGEVTHCALIPYDRALSEAGQMFYITNASSLEDEADDHPENAADTIVEDDGDSEATQTPAAPPAPASNLAVITEAQAANLSSWAQQFAADVRLANQLTLPASVIKVLTNLTLCHLITKKGIGGLAHSIPISARARLHGDPGKPPFAMPASLTSATTAEIARHIGQNSSNRAAEAAAEEYGRLILISEGTPTESRAAWRERFIEEMRAVAFTVVGISPIAAQIFNPSGLPKDQVYQGQRQERRRVTIVNRRRVKNKKTGRVRTITTTRREMRTVTVGQPVSGALYADNKLTPAAMTKITSFADSYFTQAGEIGATFAAGFRRPAQYGLAEGVMANGRVIELLNGVAKTGRIKLTNRSMAAAGHDQFTLFGVNVGEFDGAGLVTRTAVMMAAAAWARTLYPQPALASTPAAAPVATLAPQG